MPTRPWAKCAPKTVASTCTRPLKSPPTANDQQGRRSLCKYILRPPLANDRLKILDDGNVRSELKKPWSDETASVDLEPLASIARLATASSASSSLLR